MELPTQGMQRAGKIKIKFHTVSHKNWPCLSLFFHRNTCEQIRFDSHSFLPHEELWCFSPTFCFQIQMIDYSPKSGSSRLCTHRIGSLFPQIYRDQYPCTSQNQDTNSLEQEPPLKVAFLPGYLGLVFGIIRRLFGHIFNSQTHEENLSKYMNLISKDLWHIRARCVNLCPKVLQGISKKGQTLTCRNCIIITSNKVDLPMETELNLKGIKELKGVNFLFLLKNRQKKRVAEMLSLSSKQKCLI